MIKTYLGTNLSHLRKLRKFSRQDIPQIDEPLLTEKGEATLQKTDIFRKIMWFGYKNENTWHPVEVERVNEIIKLNKQKEKPLSLLENELKEKEAQYRAINRDLERLDKKFQQKSKRRKMKTKNRNRR